MRAALTSSFTRKHKVTIDSKHTFNIAPYLLNRNFLADQPDQKWVVDISYIWTCEGWLYLAIVLDLYLRRVIGWAVNSRVKRDLAIRALNMAIALRRPAKRCVHHSDRGSSKSSRAIKHVPAIRGYLKRGATDKNPHPKI